MHSPPRVFVLSRALAPQPYNSGTRMIRWGLLDGLAQAGAVVGFYSVPNPKVTDQNVEAFKNAKLAFEDYGVRFWTDRPFEQALATIEEFKPDLVLCYGYPMLKKLRDAGYEGRAGIISIDLEFLPDLIRSAVDLHLSNFRGKYLAVRQVPRTLQRSWNRYREIRAEYKRADFIINHAYHHADWHRRRHGVPVLYIPNPLSVIYPQFPKREVVTPPRFILVGHLEGVATKSGLHWFARKVYPLIEKQLQSKEIEIHLVGADKKDPELLKLLPLVVHRGYLEDLESEYKKARAMLVPTPIKLGFRTRILDAFRQGVPVIAHKANSKGFAELEPDRNILLASTARQFSAAILKLADDSDAADRLAKEAFRVFISELSAPVVIRRMLTFIEELEKNCPLEFQSPTELAPQAESR